MSLVALMALVVVSGVSGVAEAAEPSEGIVVHGAWTIEVYNPDGSIDKRLEFDNALTGGAGVIRRLLLGTASSSNNWAITFGELLSAGICPSETTGRCVIGPINSTTIGNPYGLRLTGSATVEAAGTIERVSTFLGTCFFQTSPSDCIIAPSYGATSPSFTRKVLDAGDVIAVSAGQTVQVQVDISIS